jgi:hypothetical protein
MNIAAFQSLRNGLQINAAPATTTVRKVIERGLREELLASGVFEDVEVGGSDDPDRLVLALGTFRADVGDEAAALAVERAWGALAFDHWQAHAFLTGDGHVELQAATLDRPAGRFVTLHLVAQRAACTALPMPQQRRPEQEPVEAPVLAHSA